MDGQGLVDNLWVLACAAPALPSEPTLGGGLNVDGGRGSSGRTMHQRHLAQSQSPINKVLVDERPPLLASDSESAPTAAAPLGPSPEKVPTPLEAVRRG